ncbi:MAG: TolC family protein, partial [Gammaproteobacteria bacterium]
LALQVSETYADTGFDNRLQPPYDVFSAGVQLTVPIFEGGRTQAGVRDAQARHRIAREQFEQKRREIEQETRTAYLDTVASHARIDSTGEEVRAQEKAAEAQERGYEFGVSTIVDLLEARRRLLKARVEQAKARYDYIRGLAALQVRAGGLSMPVMEEINGWMTGQ